MKHLSREHGITILRPENPPAITIDSGEELMVFCQEMQGLAPDSVEEAVGN